MTTKREKLKEIFAIKYHKGRGHALKLYLQKGYDLVFCVEVDWYIHESYKPPKQFFFISTRRAIFNFSNLNCRI